MFKKPPWQKCGPRSGSTLFASILNSSVMLGNYLQQTTLADDIFRCIFLGALRVNSSPLSFGQYIYKIWLKIILTNCMYHNGYYVLLLLQICFCFVMRKTLLSDNSQADVIEVFNSTSRYLDGLLNIDIKVRKRQ